MRIFQFISIIAIYFKEKMEKKVMMAIELFEKEIINKIKANLIVLLFDKYGIVLSDEDWQYVCK